MPELTTIHMALLAAVTVLGVVLGWVIRGSRARQEKTAINNGWQEQIEAQRLEHDRLVDQNKRLMEQNGQYQSSSQEARNQAEELTQEIQEANERRAELQRDIKDIRSNLEMTMSERDKLHSEIEAKTIDSTDREAKNERISKLALELEKWQQRVPPLVERFRQRNAEAEKLEADLAVARERIIELEINLEAAVVVTRDPIEPVDDPEPLSVRLSASDDSLKDNADAIDSGLGSPVEDRDDLQRIKGIGPAIEKTLHEMGIFRFEQIAQMSEYEIDRVANRLKGFHSRIYREDWIGQARDLHDRISDG